MASYAFGHFTRAGNLDPEAIVMAPYGEGSEAKFRRAKQGQHYRFEYKTARSAPEHRFVMAVLNALFENQDEYTDFDVFRTVIKLEAGWVFDDPPIIDGKVMWQVKPTNWSDCGHDEFQIFKNGLRKVVLERLGAEGIERFQL